MRLIADCGNSTVKLALIHEGGVWLHERLPAEAAAFDGFVADHRAAIDELVLLPTGRSAEAVAAWWGDAPCRRIGTDIALPACGQYPGFGLDRLCAGLAAVAQERADVLVIDAGTATTFTAWRAQGPQVLGGLILPGAQACADGLHAAAPTLPAVQPRWDASSLLARDPAAAIATAIGAGYGSMVAALRDRLCAETGITHLVATGGAATPLLGLILPRRAYRPSLVCEGAEILAAR